MTEHAHTDRERNHPLMSLLSFLSVTFKNKFLPPWYIFTLLITKHTHTHTHKSILTYSTSSCIGLTGIFKVFIDVQLLYNLVLVATVQQSESAIQILIFSLFWISFPFRLPQSTEYSFLCYTVGSHLLSILYIVCICQCQPPNSSHPSFPLDIYIFVLYICVTISAL